MNKILSEIKKIQQELDEKIYLQSQVEWQWNSEINIKRLKLCLLVEIGEFANELKTFKIWSKKHNLQLEKAKEELIDCLSFFIGLSLVKKIPIEEFEFNIQKLETNINDLLLSFFSETINLSIDEKPFISTYQKWWEVFCKILINLNFSIVELLEVYKKKIFVNKQRVLRGGH